MPIAYSHFPMLKLYLSFVHSTIQPIVIVPNIRPLQMLPQRISMLTIPFDVEVRPCYFCTIYEKKKTNKMSNEFITKKSNHYSRISNDKEKDDANEGAPADR